MNEIWTTARMLIERHGADAPAVAESQAIEGLLCGDAAESAAWEQVIAVVEALLDRPPTLFAGPEPVRYLH